MFLTFRAQRSAENKEAIRQLKDNLRGNLQQYHWYNDIFAGKYVDVGTLLQNRYHEFLLCTLPKLIGSFGKQAGFRVTCPYSLYYPRPNCQRPGYYIISFVMTFDWVGEDRRLRRAVRQEIPCQEIVTEAYLRMLQDTVEREPWSLAARIRKMGNLSFLACEI
jgi:hypothetical protein